MGFQFHQEWLSEGVHECCRKDPSGTLPANGQLVSLGTGSTVRESGHTTSTLVVLGKRTPHLLSLSESNLGTAALVAAALDGHSCCRCSTLHRIVCVCESSVNIAHQSCSSTHTEMCIFCFLQKSRGSCPRRCSGLFALDCCTSHGTWNRSWWQRGSFEWFYKLIS